MIRIPAEDQHMVEIIPGRWRVLAIDPERGTRVMMEALPGRPLRYVNSFAKRRRMPADRLPAEQVQNVIAGWSDMDQSWHLGLLLAPELARERRNRWCEIVRWHDPDMTEHAADARRAGEALAHIYGRSFRVAAPRRTEVVEPVETLLPELPIDLGLWRLEQSGENLQLVRSRRWLAGRVTRMLWYTFWLLVFVVLSVATLTTDLALPNTGVMLPNPQLLPYLGLATAVVLLLLLLNILREILTKPDRIVVDPQAHSIIARQGGRDHWKYNGTTTKGVYVTQVVGKRGDKRTIYHGELNLYLGDQGFRHLITQDQEEERVDSTSADPPRERVVRLTPEQIDTDLQAAGVHIANALGSVPVWYDQRTP
jgi:hypothetical protein